MPLKPTYFSQLAGQELSLVDLLRGRKHPAVHDGRQYRHGASERAAEWIVTHRNSDEYSELMAQVAPRVMAVGEPAVTLATLAAQLDEIKSMIAKLMEARNEP